MTARDALQKAIEICEKSMRESRERADRIPEINLTPGDRRAWTIRNARAVEAESIADKLRSLLSSMPGEEAGDRRRDSWQCPDCGVYSGPHRPGCSCDGQ